VWVGECFFWYRPTRVVPDQRPLNGRCCCWFRCLDCIIDLVVTVQEETEKCTSSPSHHWCHQPLYWPVHHSQCTVWSLVRTVKVWWSNIYFLLLATCNSLFFAMLHSVSSLLDISRIFLVFFFRITILWILAAYNSSGSRPDVDIEH